MTSGSFHVGSFSQSNPARGCNSSSGLTRSHCGALSLVTQNRAAAPVRGFFVGCCRFFCEHVHSSEALVVVTVASTNSTSAA